MINSRLLEGLLAEDEAQINQLNEPSIFIFESINLWTLGTIIFGIGLVIMIIFRIYRRIHKSRCQTKNDTITTNSLDNIKETQTSSKSVAKQIPMVEIRVTEGITIDPSNNNIMAPSDDSREPDKIKIPQSKTKMSNINQSKMQELLERMETTMNDYERANVVVDSAQLLIRASRIMNDLLAKHLSLNIMASEHLQDAGTKECRFCRIFFESNELPYHPDIRHTTEYCYYVPRDKRRSLLENEGLCPVCFYPGHNADSCPANIINCKYCYVGCNKHSQLHHFFSQFQLGMITDDFSLLFPNITLIGTGSKQNQWHADRCEFVQSKDEIKFLILKITVPSLSKARIVKADPFRLTKNHNGKLCEYHYKGEMYAIISGNPICVRTIAINPVTQTQCFLIFKPEYCEYDDDYMKNKMDHGGYWWKQECHPSYYIYRTVQIKSDDIYNYVYCQDCNLKYGDIDMILGGNVRIIPKNIRFSIDGIEQPIEYQEHINGTVVMGQPISKLVNDQLFSNQTNIMINSRSLEGLLAEDEAQINQLSIPSILSSSQLIMDFGNYYIWHWSCYYDHISHRVENDTFTTNSLDNIKETQTSRRLEANQIPMVEIRVTEGITIDPSNNNIMAPSDDSRELDKIKTSQSQSVPPPNRAKFNTQN
ncbi:hypothetical protein BLOT_016482 [Blomia tropicalis]|nr:hypothetical protein BLOT_016482 [Blomia tropicalis]